MKTRNPSPGRYLGGRRQFLCCGAGFALALLQAGPARAAPWSTECRNTLSSALRDFAQQRLQGLETAALWDAHAHLLGNGDAGSGAALHPSLTQGFNLIERARRRIILDAACVPADAASVDQAYLERWRHLARDFPQGARWLLFAFEQAHDDAGRPAPDHSTVHVPDAYAQSVARRWPETFEWVASIHPYRDDALTRLQAAVSGGARAIKWLPGAMNIDLRDARCKPFYETLSRLDVPLIVHCGEEKAVPGARRHDLGNPLHVRAPLNLGVRVIVAHCASLGLAVDEAAKGQPEVPAFDLFARLMDEQAHGARLLGDISAVMQANRDLRIWQALVQRSAWHGRLLQGSDYPLPGLKWLTRLPRIVEAGLLDADDARQLEELRESNALLFDLCLKRSLSLNGQRLPASVFETRRHFQSAQGARAAHPRDPASPPLTASLGDTRGATRRHPG